MKFKMARYMKRFRYKNWKALFSDLLAVLFVAGTVGFALKFSTYFDKWVFFPSFPNILDSTFLVSAVLYLTWKMKRWNHNLQWYPDFFVRSLGVKVGKYSTKLRAVLLCVNQIFSLVIIQVKGRYLPTSELWVQLSFSPRIIDAEAIFKHG